MNADTDLVVSLYDRCNGTLRELEDARRRRNENAQAMKSPMSAEDRALRIEEGKTLKETTPASNRNFRRSKPLCRRMAKSRTWPTPPRPAERGQDNLEVKRVGAPTRFSYLSKRHVELGQISDIIDSTRRQRSRARSSITKNEGVILSSRLCAMPLIFSRSAALRDGHAGCRKNRNSGSISSTPAGESNVYTLEGEGTCLIGTAEITLGGYHSGAVFEKDLLPIRFAAFPTASGGKPGGGPVLQGLYRVHQFTKVKCSCTACLRTPTHARELRSIEEEFFTSLVFLSGRRYCTGDLGAPAYRKWDLEAWMPGRTTANGEDHLNVQLHDYQARRLNVRYRDCRGEKPLCPHAEWHCHRVLARDYLDTRKFPAGGRLGQDSQGSIPYCGFDVIPPRGNA